jgi:hypothetical protein
MVAADKTNEHGGSSANPPAASLYGERNMITIEYVLISISRPFWLVRSWRKAAIGTAQPIAHVIDRGVSS